MIVEILAPAVVLLLFLATGHRVARFLALSVATTLVAGAAHGLAVGGTGLRLALFVLALLCLGFGLMGVSAFARRSVSLDYLRGLARGEGTE